MNAILQYLALPLSAQLVLKYLEASLTSPLIQEPRAVHEHVAPIRESGAFVLNLNFPLFFVLIPSCTDDPMFKFDKLAQVLVTIELLEVFQNLRPVLVWHG